MNYFLRYFLTTALIFSGIPLQAQTAIKGPALIEGTTTVTAASGTTTLTKDSNPVQIINGTLAQTIVLPAATTLPVGRSFEFYSTTTKVVTINANGGTLLKNLSPNEKSKFRLTANGTAAGTWAVENNAAVNVAQATFFGGMDQAGASGCNYTENTSTSETDFKDLGTGTGCSAWTINTGGTGTVAAVGTNDHRLTASGMGAGYYEIQIQGGPWADSAGTVCNFRLSDGTNTYQPQTLFAGSSSTVSPTLTYGANYSTAPGTLTFKIQAADSSSGGCWIYNGNAGRNLSWKIKYFPSQSQAVVKMDQTNYDWRSYTPTFTGFGTPTNVECQEKRDGADNLIRCKFTPGTTTPTEARVSLPTGLVAAGTSIIPSIQVAGDWTGTTGIPAGPVVLIEPGVAYVTFGYMNATYSGLFKQNANNMTGSSPLSFTARVPISGWTGNQNAPLISGGVTSSSTGLENLNRARISITGASTCTFTQTGDWVLSCTASSKIATVTFKAGYFSGAPDCWGTTQGSVGDTHFRYDGGLPTTTSVVFRAADNTNTAQNENVSLFCLGPR